MNYNTTYNKILTDENMMETIQHGSKEYPFHFYYDNLELFDFHCIEWHWHTEFEFVYVETGTVYFGISDKQLPCQKVRECSLILKYCIVISHRERQLFRILS